ncbi:MAG: glutathione S-transferase family protein [Rickettsiaceae bacterium]|nr:glutathione S-transferase family protein [Rickettsiaceae bacterium]
MKLYHHILCPKSRFARVLLEEKNIPIELESIEYWHDVQKHKSIDPTLEFPILQIDAETIISGYYPLMEYIAQITNSFLGDEIDALQIARIRKILYWLNERFHKEVTHYILNEKLFRLSVNGAFPRTDFLRAARINFIHHLNYFDTQMQKFGYLASPNLSIADISFACHISVLDYFSEINWDRYLWLKEWYAPIKSRPSFRNILHDRISFISPPAHYDNLDF